MSNWSAGYVSDIDYVYGYARELNPLQIKLALLSAGIVYPEVETACELGFGQGLGVNLHAAASDTKWSGTDFNPSQAGFAQELAAVSGSDIQVFDQSFEEFANRSDLPDFDYIGLHGIWSWISDVNRRIIVDFIRRKLRVGGILYISYNALPGFATFAPVRHLLTEHASVLGSEGKGIVNRIEGALEFAEKLFDTNPVFSRINPTALERFKKLKGQDRHYLAHEYFNKDWHPMHFATVAEWLAPAKVQYACSAHYLDHIDALNLTAEQQQFLQEIPDTNFRESVRDFMVNQPFRRDYWVKGARTMADLDRAESLRSQRVLLISHRPDISLKVTGMLGEAQLTEAIYSPILDHLESHKIMTLGEIELALKGSGIEFVQMLQAIMVLAGANHLAAVNPDEVIKRVSKQCSKMNFHLMRMARSSGNAKYLASPITGGGVEVDRFGQLFLLSISNGKNSPQEWVQYAWQLLSVQGSKLLKEGVALETAEENIAELEKRAREFEKKQLAIYKAMRII